MAGAAVEAGATGYLLNNTPREELLKAIGATARGDPVLSPSVASWLVGRASGPVDRSLSAREIEVLRPHAPLAQVVSRGFRTS